MANFRPYCPTAKTKKRLSASTTSGSTAIKISDGAGEVSVRIRSITGNAVDAYVAFGNASVTCDPTLDDGFTPGGTEVFTVFGQNGPIYAAVATESGTATIEVSFGSGI